LTEAELPSIFKRFGNSRRFCYGFASRAQREFHILNYAAAYLSPLRFAAHGPVR